MPPYLAGRESEQRLIQSHLDHLVSNAAPGSDIVIYGPRGNGKTALLEWALREARTRKIKTIDFSSKEIQSAEWLEHQLSILPRWLRALRGLSAFGFGMQTLGSAEARISSALALRARRRGLVVAIDEAHTLAREAGQHILHAVQRLGRKDLPVILLLAGTPDLPRHLNSMEASFWGRSEILLLGLLKPGAVADAIRVPMKAKGRSITERALAQIVEASQGYPFFVQLWGRFLWEQMADPAAPATVEDVNRARPLFEARRSIYYRDRHAELEGVRLAFVAARLSQAFSDGHRRTNREVNKAIGPALESEGRDADTGAILTVRDRLHDLGYIWSAGGESRTYFRPGIPGLMRYVARSEDFDMCPVFPQKAMKQPYSHMKR